MDEHEKHHHEEPAEEREETMKDLDVPESDAHDVRGGLAKRESPLEKK
jgi:hypothetical protein